MKKSSLGLVIFLIFTCSLLATNAFPFSLPEKRIQQSEKQYFLILFGFVFFLPEIIELHLEPDGTFSLQSDLWVEPAQGTYEENIFLLQGSGTTGNFFDPDFEEDIEIQYQFLGLLLGLQDLALLGIGTRDFTFEDGLTVPENFIFTGLGF